MARFKLILEMADGTTRDYQAVKYHVGGGLLRFKTREQADMTVNLSFVKTITALQIDAAGRGK